MRRNKKQKSSRFGKKQKSRKMHVESLEMRSLLTTLPIYNFGQAEFAVDETDANQTTNVVQIKRSGNLDAASTVEVVLTADSATLGEDYNGETISVTFDANEDTKSVEIEILGDTLVETSETISLSLKAADGEGEIGSTTPQPYRRGRLNR